MKTKPHPYDYLRKHWFLFGILLCIVFAAVKPNLGAREGPLKPEYTVKYGAISLIFLISGLSLKSETLLHTIRQYKLHIFVQIFTFLLVPILIRMLVGALKLLAVDSWLLKGLITVACMPPPVSSAVIMTRASNGNESAAIFNSVLGSFLGILITPVSLLLNLGITTLVPLLGTLIQLCTTVLVPLVLGQVARRCTSFRGHNLPLNAAGQLSLLLVIYTTFCDTFNTRDTVLSAADILVTIILVLLVQITLLAISFALARKMEDWYSPADVAAILFCSTHKSLTLGVPILRIMFHGFSHLSQISLPLLVYHPTQIILGGLFVSGLKEWVRAQKDRKLPI